MAVCRIVKTDATPDGYDKVVSGITTSGLSQLERRVLIAAIEEAGTITTIEVWDTRKDAEDWGNAVRLLDKGYGYPGYKIISERILEIHKFF